MQLTICETQLTCCKWPIVVQAFVKMMFTVYIVAWSLRTLPPAEWRSVFPARLPIWHHEKYRITHTTTEMTTKIHEVRLTGRLIGKYLWLEFCWKYEISVRLSHWLHPRSHLRQKLQRNRTHGKPSMPSNFLWNQLINTEGFLGVSILWMNRYKYLWIVTLCM
jgi:hypothetical protein